MEGLLIKPKKQSDGVPESQQTMALWRETDRSPVHASGMELPETLRHCAAQRNFWVIFFLNFLVIQA
jgi:hypothetical protein